MSSGVSCAHSGRGLRERGGPPCRWAPGPLLLRLLPPDYRPGHTYRPPWQVYRRKPGWALHHCHLRAHAPANRELREGCACDQRPASQQHQQKKQHRSGWRQRDTAALCRWRHLWARCATRAGAFWMLGPLRPPGCGSRLPLVRLLQEAPGPADTPEARRRCRCLCPPPAKAAPADLPRLRPDRLASSELTSTFCIKPGSIDACFATTGSMMHQVGQKACRGEHCRGHPLVMR